MSPRVIAKRIRRRDQRVQDYLDAPNVPAKKPAITSTIHKLPPAQIPDAAAPAGGPPPDSSAPLNNPDPPRPAPEKPTPGDA